MGVGGIGVSALAKFAVSKGASVTGSDLALMTLHADLVTVGFWTDSEPEGFSDHIFFLASGGSKDVMLVCQYPSERMKEQLTVAFSPNNAEGVCESFAIGTLDGRVQVHSLATSPSREGGIATAVNGVHLSPSTAAGAPAGATGSALAVAAGRDAPRR